MRSQGYQSLPPSVWECRTGKQKRVIQYPSLLACSSWKDGIYGTFHRGMKGESEMLLCKNSTCPPGCSSSTFFIHLSHIHLQTTTFDILNWISSLFRQCGSLFQDFLPTATGSWIARKGGLIAIINLGWSIILYTNLNMMSLKCGIRRFAICKGPFRVMWCHGDVTKIYI